MRCRRRAISGIVTGVTETFRERRLRYRRRDRPATGIGKTAP